MIRWLTMVRVAWRLLFIQSSWNFNNMQGIGMFYASYPALKKLDIAEKGMRHFSRYFNTNPYMAGVVVGVALHYEEQRGEHLSSEYKDTLASFFGAIGDAFFWASFRPAIFALGVTMYFVEPLRPLCLWLPLGIYIVVTQGARFYGLYLGYVHGMAVVQRVHPRLLHLLIDSLKNSHFIFAGVIFSITMYRIFTLYDTYYLGIAMLFVLLNLIMFHFMRVNFFILIISALMFIIEFLRQLI